MVLSNSNHKSSDVLVYFPLLRCIGYTHSTVPHTYQGSVLYAVSLFLPVHSCYVAALLCMLHLRLLSLYPPSSSFLLLVFMADDGDTYRELNSIPTLERFSICQACTVHIFREQGSQGGLC